MYFTLLGTGGALAMPRPFCHCPNCARARLRGTPHERTGPSLFIPEEGGILFDTPEEIRLQLEREQISGVGHIFFTHWHPDHTQGLRIMEQIQHVYHDQPAKKRINVYIPTNAIPDFKQYCQALWYFEQQGYVNIIELDDRNPVKIGKLFIIPIDFKRPDRVRYGYLVVDGAKKLMYAPCSIFGMKIDHFYEGIECLIMETGWLGKTLETRAGLPPKHAWLDHISFEENVDLVRQLCPKRAILTHIDGTRHLTDGANHSKLVELAHASGLSIAIAFDGMKIEI